MNHFCETNQIEEVPKRKTAESEIENQKYNN